MSEPEKVLITGASGFIGRALCQSLVAQGIKVRAVCRKPLFLGRRIETVIVPSLGPEANWEEALSGIDCVVHLAAKVHDTGKMTQEKDRDYQRINVQGTEKLAAMATRHQVKRFIMASSVKAMAESTLPGEALNEQQTPQPQDAYGKSKLEGEYRLQRICNSSAMDYFIFRLPLVYGPHVQANMRKLIQLVDKGRILPFGLITNKRSMIFMGNLLDLIHSSIQFQGKGNKVMLVSDNEEFSTPSLVRMIGRALQKPDRIIPVPPAALTLIGRAGDFFTNLTGKPNSFSSQTIERLTGSLVIDSTYCRNLFQWTPPFGVQYGINRMIDWYRQVASCRGNSVDL